MNGLREEKARLRMNENWLRSTVLYRKNKKSIIKDAGERVVGQGVLVIYIYVSRTVCPPHLHLNVDGDVLCEALAVAFYMLHLWQEINLYIHTYIRATQ